MHKEKNVAPLPALRSLWNYQQPEETERKFRALIPRAKEETDLSYFVELIAHLGRSISLQNKHTEAHEVLDQAMPFVTKEMATPAIQYYLERGRVYFWQKDRDRENALKFYTIALALAEEKGDDFLALDTIHMLASLPEKQEDKLPWHLKSLELLEKTSCSRAKKWSAVLYNNIGSTYYQLGQYDKALEVCKKALAYRELQPQFPNEIFQAKYALGRAYRAANDVEAALEIQKSLIEEVKNGREQPIGHIQLEMAECLLQSGKPEQAKPFFQAAYAFLCNFEWKQNQTFWAAANTEELGRMKMLGGQV